MRGQMLEAVAQKRTCRTSGVYYMGDKDMLQHRGVQIHGTVFEDGLAQWNS